MKTMKWIAALGVACSMMGQTSWAARTPLHEAAESQAYGRKFGGMIGRGVLNISTCFVDLLVNVVRETQNGPPLVGTLVGLGKGAGCTSLRALSGGVDLITFWVPGFNGFPVSDSYENCLLSGPPAHAALSAPPIESEMEGVVSPSPVTVTPQPERPRYTK